MYAVIRTGGKQYKVEAGERLEVERLGDDIGSDIELTPVLLVDGETVLATPGQLEGSVVKARIVGRRPRPQDRRLHLQAEEQQPSPLRPPSEPDRARDHRHRRLEGRRRRQTAKAAARPPRPTSRPSQR